MQVYGARGGMRRLPHPSRGTGAAITDSEKHLGTSGLTPIALFYYEDDYRKVTWGLLRLYYHG